MSRAGYSDYDDDFTDLELGRWRGAVRSAMRGKRGQAFLREALEALDAMPDKRLIAGELVIDGIQSLIVGADELCDMKGAALPMGSCCLLGAVARYRKIDVSDLCPDDIKAVAPRFNLAEAMTRELVYENDEGGDHKETPEQRWIRMRSWVASEIRG